MKHFATGLVIGGIDEVGRGCLAGAVVAGCVVFDYSRLSRLPLSSLRLIRDSKSLSAKQRERVLPVIHQVARAWAIGSAQVAEIERLGITTATFLAMKRALLLMPTIDRLLIDGNFTIPALHMAQVAIPKGDKTYRSIAAASIIAKVHRDRYMHAQAEKYPAYGFERHVGYGTLFHRQMLAKHGACPLHRRNFQWGGV